MPWAPRPRPSQSGLQVSQPAAQPPCPHSPACRATAPWCLCPPPGGPDAGPDGSCAGPRPVSDGSCSLGTWARERPRVRLTLGIGGHHLTVQSTMDWALRALQKQGRVIPMVRVAVVTRVTHQAQHRPQNCPVQISPGSRAGVGGPHMVSDRPRRLSSLWRYG